MEESASPRPLRVSVLLLSAQSWGYRGFTCSLGIHLMSSCFAASSSRTEPSDFPAWLSVLGLVLHPWTSQVPASGSKQSSLSNGFPDQLMQVTVPLFGVLSSLHTAL